MNAPIEIVALLVLVVWIVLRLDPSRRSPLPIRLPERPRVAPAPGDVIAVVPARDEAAVLPQTLPSLLAQEALRVVLVDDRSRDDTAATAARLAEEAGAAARLRVVSKEAPPDGWSGKVHAMASGVAAARGAGEAPRWWLFTDADIEHRRDSVAALVEQAGSSGADLVSVMARLRARSRWEKLLVPPFVYFFHLLYPFRLVASGRSKVAAAAGGCVLVRDAALERAGGVEAIRDALIDDVALATAVKRVGGSLWLGFDDGVVSVRPYDTLAGLWAMISRCAFHQLRYSWTLLASTLAGLAIVFVSPPLIAGAALAAACADDLGRASALRAAAAAVAAWGLGASALLPFVRHHRVGAVWTLGLPAAAALYGAMTFTSAWRHATGHGPTWKGRAVRAPDA